MAVKIKLMRLGKIRAPHYRIVVADARTKRDGRAIETIGKYHPTEEPSLIELDSERAQYWLSVGAQPTEPVQAILRVTGDWQKFRGEAGAEGTLRTRQPKADKKLAFEAAALEAAGEAGATTPKGKRTPRKEEAAQAAAGAAEPTGELAQPGGSQPSTTPEGAPGAQAPTDRAGSGSETSGA